MCIVYTDYMIDIDVIIHAQAKLKYILFLKKCNYSINLAPLIVLIRILIKNKISKKIKAVGALYERFLF